LFTLNLDASVNGQALYVPNLTIGGATHNVTLVYTSNSSAGPCSVYAFDADNGAQLWHHAFTNTDGNSTLSPLLFLPAGAYTLTVAATDPTVGVYAFRLSDIATANHVRLRP